MDIDRHDGEIDDLDTRVSELEVKHKDKGEENDDLWRAVGVLEGMKTMLSDRITDNENAIEDLTIRV